MYCTRQLEGQARLNWNHSKMCVTEKLQNIRNTIWETYAASSAYRSGRVQHGKYGTNQACILINHALKFLLFPVEGTFLQTPEANKVNLPSFLNNNKGKGKLPTSRRVH